MVRTLAFHVKNIGSNPIRVNYYNLKLRNPKDFWNIVSTGHITEDNILIGSHDAREAIRHKIKELREYGEFITPWVEKPSLWLIHHGDEQIDGSYDEKSIKWDNIMEKRIEQFPEHVKKAIGEI